MAGLLIVGILSGALLTAVLANRHQTQQLRLLRLENTALEQEIRLLRQQIEAERILAKAAFDRLPVAAPSDATRPPAQ
jgi:cell division protein FtsB